jgi:hypothetical protein
MIVDIYYLAYFKYVEPQNLLNYNILEEKKELIPCKAQVTD